MSEPGRWPQGQHVIEGMLERKELEEVEPSPQHASTLLAEADGHLQAARAVKPVHAASAYLLLYDAARKAMAAALAKQGLRATSDGGHLAVQNAIEAQMGNAKAVVGSYRRLRTTRNDTAYPKVDTAPVDDVDVQDGLDSAADIVEAMAKFVPLLGPWS